MVKYEYLLGILTQLNQNLQIQSKKGVPSDQVLSDQVASYREESEQVTQHQMGLAKCEVSAL